MAPYERFVKLVFIKDTKLPETAPYEILVKLLFIKDTRLVETAPYDKFLI